MLWGITGCSGTGASTVASVWRKQGASVCSLDEIGHRFLARKTVGEELETALGMPGLSRLTVENIRIELREKAFRNRETLEKINGVIHRRLQRWTAVSAGSLAGKMGIFVLDAALIFELGLQKQLDFTVTVNDSKERALERLVTRDGLTAEAASGRWESQIDIREKCMRSHFVIDNSGSLTELKNKADEFYNKVIKKMEDV